MSLYVPGCIKYKMAALVGASGTQNKTTECFPLNFRSDKLDSVQGPIVTLQLARSFPAGSKVVLKNINLIQYTI